MDLLIIRHAIACERDHRRWPDDRERPLTPEGMLRAKRAAKGLKGLADRPACVLTSPLIRAVQTAMILSQYAGWPQARECAALSPAEPPEAVLEVLHGRAGRLIAVVGHQPQLGRLIARALPGEVAAEAFALKKFAAGLLSFAGPPQAGRATLRWLLQPAILRAARAR